MRRTGFRSGGRITIRCRLVLTILSQNTSDGNSGRAFVRLLEAFPSWDAVMDAPLGKPIEAIQPGGLAPTKAPRIQSVLRDIRARRGDYDLGFLRRCRSRKRGHGSGACTALGRRPWRAC